jgi:hypothetical protein
VSYEDNRLVIGPSNGTPSGGTMTGTSTLTSDWVKLSVHRMISFQAKWASTPVGTFSFEVSNDPDPAFPVLGVTVLTPPTKFANGNPNGAAGDFTFEFPYAPWKWIRIKYTNISGSGVLSVGVEAKGGS